MTGQQALAHDGSRGVFIGATHLLIGDSSPRLAYPLPTRYTSPPRTIPHQIKNKALPLPTGTTIHRTIPHQDNSPLGPLPRNKTTHQDQYMYGG